MKKNIFKRISCFIFAFVLALISFVVPVTNSTASAKTVINTTDGMTNIRFEPFNVMSSMKAPSTWGGTGAIIPMQFTLTVFSESSVTDNGTDNSRFSMSLNGRYGYFTQNYLSYEYSNKLFLDKSLSDGFDKAYVDQFLNTENDGYYPLPDNGIEMYGWTSVYGFVPSNVWYQLSFSYDLNNALLVDVWSTYNDTANVQNQFAVPFIHYLCTTNINDTGFDWSRVNYLRHSITSPRGMVYSIGEVEGQDVYQSVRFNSYDIYDFCITENRFYRFVFLSYNNNLPFKQDIVYFENLGYSVGYNQGYDLGYREGLTTNSSESYEKGYADGYQVGENIGYENGVNKQENQFTNLITAVIDVPIKTFLSLFDINIFGYDLKAFVISLFSIALIIAIVRFVT